MFKSLTKRKKSQSLKHMFFVYRRLCDVIHISPLRYVHEFLSLAVPTPPLQIRDFILYGYLMGLIER